MRPCIKRYTRTRDSERRCVIIPQAPGYKELLWHRHDFIFLKRDRSVLYVIWVREGGVRMKGWQEVMRIVTMCVSKSLSWMRRCMRLLFVWDSDANIRTMCILKCMCASVQTVLQKVNKIFGEHRSNGLVLLPRIRPLRSTVRKCSASYPLRISQNVIHGAGAHMADAVSVHTLSPHPPHPRTHDTVL